MLGNLPYTATKDTLAQHLKKLEPKHVRLMTDKDTGKGKGIAFVEFHDWDTMNTALTKYHHSTFDDGLSPARKINVELS
jgi:nucleolar protein 6